MPSKLKTLAIRLREEDWLLLSRLQEAVGRNTGVPHSQADTVRAALEALRGKLKISREKTTEGA